MITYRVGKILTKRIEMNNRTAKIIVKGKGYSWRALVIEEKVLKELYELMKAYYEKEAGK
ncbi:hypothetical protein ES705_16978 [subsurface metagenome]|jgi:hypothetical protein